MKTGEIPELPKYRVIGEYMNSFSLVVGRDASKTQIKNLILALQAARRNKTLSALVPQWQQRGTDPSFQAIIFRNSGWATEGKLVRFIRMSLQSPSGQAFSREYVKHVTANYFYSDIEEYAQMGYFDGISRSPQVKNIPLRECVETAAPEPGEEP